ncbi:MAG: hypothetical protein KBG21_04980 [Ignavibacteria bacterium]|nr:hypothetical protein [Ignavibacteria bacterium]
MKSKTIIKRMTKENIKKRKDSVNGLRLGLLQALEFSKGSIPKGTKITKLSNIDFDLDFNPQIVSSIKMKHPVSAIARTLGVTSATVKSWEDKKSRPSKTAQRMLYLIDKKPEIMSVFDAEVTYK